MSTSLSSRSAIHPTRQQLDELDALLQRMLELPVSGPDQDRGSQAPPPPAASSGQRSEAATDQSERYAQMAPPAGHDSIGPRVVQSESPDERPAEPAGGHAPEWVPLRSSWQPSPQTWGPLARQWQAQQESRTMRSRPSAETTDHDPAARSFPEAEHEDSIQDEDALLPLPNSWKADARAVTQPAVVPPPKQIETSTSADQPPLPISLWPFAAIDTAFDMLLMLTGPLGRRLHSPAGKSLLASIGVIALLAAAAQVTADWFGWTW
jgi:hypothetical protein